MHSKHFSLVNKYYPKLWSISRVRQAVKSGWITPEEFFEITEEQY